MILFVINLHKSNAKGLAFCQLEKKKYFCDIKAVGRLAAAGFGRERKVRATQGIPLLNGK